MRRILLNRERDKKRLNRCRAVSRAYLCSRQQDSHEYCNDHDDNQQFDQRKSRSAVPYLVQPFGSNSFTMFLVTSRRQLPKVATTRDPLGVSGWHRSQVHH